jgi:hypothetical protein
MQVDLVLQGVLAAVRGIQGDLAARNHARHPTATVDDRIRRQVRDEPEHSWAADASRDQTAAEPHDGDAKVQRLLAEGMAFRNAAGIRALEEHAAAWLGSHAAEWWRFSGTPNPE